MVTLINPQNHKKLIPKNGGFGDESGVYFPIVDGALRLTPKENYTENFGFQWNLFRQTQIDSHVKDSFSKERFFKQTAWIPADLAGLDILEVGCGAGRFSQVILDNTEANLYSLDYSDAVSANYENNKHHAVRFQLFQASIYEMPFPANTFDKVFCFGVLQHTPDFKRSIKALVEKTKPGGEIVVDFYPIKGWWTKLHSKYILRPFTKRMSNQKLLKLIRSNMNWLIRTYFFFDKLKVGKIVNRFLPVCDIKNTLPNNLTREQLREWAILDTFDMFSPEHDHPQRINTVEKWFKEFGTEVSFAGMVEYRSGMDAAVVRAIKK
jgi:SAM-dependent methyltransferase